MKKHTNSKVPRIRFKGFEGGWETKRVDGIAPLQRGFDLPTVKVRPGRYPVVYSNGILRNHHEYKCVAPGVVTGRSGTIGKVTFVSDNYWPHNTSLWVTNFFKNDPRFIYYFYVYFRLERFNAGSTIPTLNRNDVHAIKSNIPITAEQTKIGGYFRELDRLIGLHQRKHDKLVTLKKAMLQKMFPQPGATTPEIRFKGFSGDWVEKKLHSLADRYDNLRVPVSASNRIPGNTPYYGANGIQDYVDGYTHEGEFILVAEDGANDLKNYPVQYVSGKVWVNNHAHVLQGKEGLAETRFLKYSFSQINVEVFLVGGGRSKLNAETMMQMALCVPTDIAEQQQIGTYFRTLDELISKHATQLQKLQQIKSACLEKMFV